PGDGVRAPGRLRHLAHPRAPAPPSRPPGRGAGSLTGRRARRASYRTTAHYPLLVIDGQTSPGVAPHSSVIIRPPPAGVASSVSGAGRGAWAPPGPARVSGGAATPPAATAGPSAPRPAPAGARATSAPARRARPGAGGRDTSSSGRGGRPATCPRSA